jgi:hypothetical protein|tara:strand:+ start:576 stop:1010 length:435 start_codon:yes stop_codon:yes gene_type:complete
MRESDIAYLAGLFDGEGSLQCKKGLEKKKKHKGEGYRMSNSMRISMEIAMTDEAVIRWVHETLQVGSVIKRNVKGLNKAGKKYKTQWRWRCTFREAYYVCRLIWPYVQVKLHKVEQLIDHYTSDHVFDGNVVSLQQYKEAMTLE